MMDLCQTNMLHHYGCLLSASQPVAESVEAGHAVETGLISDLGLILVVAGITTVLFRRLKQPVVLGYILAGFLVGPHFGYFPTVVEEASIDVWAELGIIFLLFSLGLEFSFKKLLHVGGSAATTALVIVIGMMTTGFLAGRLMDFSNISSLFLGGMLSMSSTTIILKALTDLGMTHRRFAPQVLAVLIVEDLFAVIMMVMLSSIAINNSVSGEDMLWSIGKLSFFLILWFLVGVYVIPSFLKRQRRFLTGETTAGVRCWPLFPDGHIFLLFRFFHSFGCFCNGVYSCRDQRGGAYRQSCCAGQRSLRSNLFRVGRNDGRSADNFGIYNTYFSIVAGGDCRHDSVWNVGYAAYRATAAYRY